MIFKTRDDVTAYHQDKVVQAPGNRWLLTSSPGLGKASANSAKVLTPTGFVLMGAIRAGDRVIGVDGCPTRVEAVFPQGKCAIYSVHFNDGTSTRVTGEHLWEVSTKTDRRTGKHRVLTTYQLAQWKGAPLALPQLLPVQHDSAEYALDPWLLGVMLGDASFKQNRQIVLHIENAPKKKFIQERTGTLYWGSKTPEVAVIKSLDLMNRRSWEKFIPDSYLVGSELQRTCLLQGLMDTDGYVSKDGTIVQYSSSSKRLALGVAALVRSLGGIARMSVKMPKYTYKKEKRTGREHYTVTISCLRAWRVCTDPDKQARLGNRTGTWFKRRTFTHVAPSGYEEATCIRVADKRRLYATDDYIPTHNTGQFLSAAKELGLGRMLIACPAVVREVWLREMAKWWPDRVGDVGILYSSAEGKGISKPERARRAEAREKPIQVVSYQLLKTVVLTGWDGIALDEVQRTKNPTTTFAQAAMGLVQKNSKAAVVGLTGTPAANQPLDICGVAEVIWKGRFGGTDKRWGLSPRCKKRYAQALANVYATSGYTYSGANPRYIEELKFRLSCISSRTTRDEVAHLLPAFDVRYEVVETGAGEINQIQDIQTVLNLAGDAKIPWALSWMEDRVGSEPICIGTFRRETAYKIAAAAEKKFKHTPVYCLTGDMTPEKRNKVLEGARDEMCVIVATMDSVGIGIDLTFCTAALVVEMSYKPEIVMQFLRRFSRFSSVVPGDITIVAAKGTRDEAVVSCIRHKIEDINLAVEAGAVEEEIAEKLGGSKDFAEMVEQAAASLDEGYSLWDLGDY